jgi:hypothetical protein
MTTPTVINTAPDFSLPMCGASAFTRQIKGRWRRDRITRVDHADDIAQGRHPANGTDCWGHVLFQIPRLPQTPTHMTVYLHARHWFYNAGGAAVLSVVDGDGGRLTEPLVVNGWPKPGAKVVDLPTEWLPHFRWDGRGAGIGIGLREGLDDELRLWGRFDPRVSQLLVWEGAR